MSKEVTDWHAALASVQNTDPYFKTHESSCQNVVPSHLSDLGNNLNLDVYVSKQWNENNVTNPGDIIGSIASPKKES